jgi:hypothetical protein
VNYSPYHLFHTSFPFSTIFQHVSTALPYLLHVTAYYVFVPLHKVLNLRISALRFSPLLSSSRPWVLAHKPSTTGFGARRSDTSTETVVRQCPARKRTFASSGERCATVQSKVQKLRIRKRRYGSEEEKVLWFIPKRSVFENFDMFGGRRGRWIHAMDQILDLASVRSSLFCSWLHNRQRPVTRRRHVSAVVSTLLAASQH